MTSRRFKGFVLILCTIVFWLVSRPSAVRFSFQDAAREQGSANRQPAMASSDSGSSSFAGDGEAEVPARVLRSRSAFRGTPADLRRVIHEARAQGQEVLWSAQYKNYRERFDVKAVPKRMYQSSFGNKVREIGGYAVYGVAHSPSTLENFDNTRLPVITDDRARTGIVNGDILVVFRDYPSSVERFASLYNLKVIRELRRANSVFFSPRQLPTNLVARVEALSADPHVKKADLDVVFRSPVPQ